jgi:hypothetical protein
MTTNNNSEAMPAIVKLKVGEHKFTTTRATLCRIPGTVLEAMFSGRHQELHQDEEGHYFIDRDGKHFHHILNFLRHETIVTLPSDVTEKSELAFEADYYGLDGLVSALQRPVVDIAGKHLDSQTLSIRNEEDGLRRKFASRQADGLDPHVGLTSLFRPDNGMQPLPLTYKPQQDVKDSEVFMSNFHEQAERGTPVTVSSLSEFVANFNRKHPDLLRHLESILLEEHVIIAGGSVLESLTASDGIRTSKWWGHKSDIDLFLYDTTPEEAARITKRIFDALGEEHLDDLGDPDADPWAIVRCNGVINLHKVNIGSSLGAEETCQVVLRLYDSPAEVLFGFDVDCCCCAYDGRNIWATRRCLMALETGVNILNPLHSWPNKPSYEERLVKYASRGFPVVIPGLDESCIDDCRIRQVELATLKGLARLLKLSLRAEIVSPGTLSIYDGDGAYDAGAIIPAVYVDNVVRNMGRARNIARHDGGRDYLRRSFFHLDYFDITPTELAEAWEEIVDAGPNAPEGLPRHLEDAWVLEKRSREYRNLHIDKFDLDNVYYSEAYKK